MKAERWQQVERLYHSTLEKEVGERAAFLIEACSGDEGLRREVESLLGYEEQAENFIESPALEVAANMIGAEPRATVVAGQAIKPAAVSDPPLMLLPASSVRSLPLVASSMSIRPGALRLSEAVETRCASMIRSPLVLRLNVSALMVPTVDGSGRSGSWIKLSAETLKA